MKHAITKLIITLTTPLVILSCNNSNNNTLKKNITGRAGEMVVVMSKDMWSSAPGDSLRNIVARPQLSLPQSEPIFDLFNVPHNAFKDIFKTTRNIIMTNISATVEKPEVAFKSDVWAKSQAVVEISAKNITEFIKLIGENKERITNYFLNAERNRLISGYKKTYNHVILDTLQHKFNLSMYCQPGYKIAVDKDNFLWVRYDTPNITQGIFVYSVKYTTDSIFTADYLVRIRDKFLRKYIRYQKNDAYMTTEKRVDQVINTIKHNGNYAVEMRGLWKTVNDFMGGPYVLIAELDVPNQRVVIADGFVYAPNENKRNLERQVEATLFTMKFNDQ